jgi:hypothetical protein
MGCNTVGHGQSTAVDRSVPIVAKTEDYIVYHSWEPQAVLAYGTQSPILSEVEEGVIIQLYLKHRHQNVTNSKSIARKVNTEICF